MYGENSDALDLLSTLGAVSREHDVSLMGRSSASPIGIAVYCDPNEMHRRLTAVRVNVVQLLVITHAAGRV